MKKIILLLVVLVTFSCSTSDNNLSENHNHKLFKIVSFDPLNNESTETKFFYDSNDHISYILYLSSGQGTTKHEFVYDNGQLIKIKIYDNGSYLSQNDTNYTYSNGNVATESRRGYANDEYVYYYNYNNLNQLISTDRYLNGVLDTQTTYSYNSQGNIISEHYINNNSSYSSTTTHEYDNNPNPFSNLEQTRYTSGLLRKLAKNNITKTTSGSSETNIIYEYNESGYPSKAIFPRPYVGYDYTLTYFYY